MTNVGSTTYFDEFMQERRNSIASARELHLSCTNPSIFSLWQRKVLVMGRRHGKEYLQLHHMFLCWYGHPCGTIWLGLAMIQHYTIFYTSQTTTNVGHHSGTEITNSLAELWGMDCVCMYLEFDRVIAEIDCTFRYFSFWVVVGVFLVIDVWLCICLDPWP